MSKQKAENYAFPCSLIRANEKTLLTAQDLERVMDAKDMQQAMHILAEFGYGDGRELTDPRGFEEVLAGEMNRVSELISSLSVDAAEFALFRLPKDYHNLKVLLKAEALGIDPLPLMSAGGNFDPKQMLDMLRERNLIMLDLEMRQGLTDAAELYAKSGDPQEIDLVLDHACYAQMRRMAEAHENTFIRDYCELEVDLLNCRTFVRLREVGKPWEFFQKVFLQAKLHRQLRGTLSAVRGTGLTVRLWRAVQPRRCRGSQYRTVHPARKALRRQTHAVLEGRALCDLRTGTDRGVLSRQGKRKQESADDPDRQAGWNGARGNQRKAEGNLCIKSA